MQQTSSIYGVKYSLVNSYFIFFYSLSLFSASSAGVRRHWAQHRRENRLKPSWQTLVEQAIISTAETNSVRDCSCCLSFVIGVGFCQIGSWQHQHSSFFQVGIWESVKVVHPSPGSPAGKGTVRIGYEARMDLFAGADLLLADSTDLCVLQLCLNKVATSITIHGMSPHQIPNSFHSHRQCLHCTLRVVRMLSKMQHQSPKLLRS